LQYLTDWRMETARRLLAEGQLPQAAIAERIGYGSEVAVIALGRARRVRTGAHASAAPCRS
jgi:AraC-like DNA-binding protein